MEAAVPLPPGGAAWDLGFWVSASDGVKIRAAFWSGDPSAAQSGASPRGLVLLLSGRTEFLEKMSVPAAELARRGFDVVSLDWRGQGLSDRLAEPRVMGHVDRFTDYHKDLAAVLAAPELADKGPVTILFAHSMGGAIGLGALYRGVTDPGAVILSAPMLGIKMSPMMKAVSRGMTAVMGAFGLMRKRPPVGDVNKAYVFEGFEGNVLTSDRAVFDWMADALRREPRLQVAMPSFRWFDESVRELEWLAKQGPIGRPALIFDGSAESVVDRSSILDAAARLPAAYVEIEGARHEALIEAPDMRAQAWLAVDEFLEAKGL